MAERRSRLSGKVTGWEYVRNDPPTLDREVIAGNHIWRLPNLLRTEVFVSDRLKSEMERRGLGPFQARPAPLD